MFGARHGFKVCTGARYIGDYIREDQSKSNWLRDHTLTWEKNIGTIRETMGRYPQESYAAVARVIQSEWIFLQRVTWDTGVPFAGMEKMLWGKNCPSLFIGKTKTLSPIVGSLSMMLVKKSVVGILNLVTSAK